jgi:hypothetical protein
LKIDWKQGRSAFNTRSPRVHSANRAPFGKGKPFGIYHSVAGPAIPVHHTSPLQYPTGPFMTEPCHYRTNSHVTTDPTYHRTMLPPNHAPTEPCYHRSNLPPNPYLHYLPNHPCYHSPPNQDAAEPERCRSRSHQPRPTSSYKHPRPLPPASLYK